MRQNVVLVRTIKVIHTATGLGLMGGVAALLVLRWAGAAPGSPAFVDSCRVVVAIHRVLIVPSMAVCVFSGFASMFAHRPYWDALWAWIKGGSGVVVLNFSVRMQSAAVRLTEPEALDAVVRADLLRTERTGLWVLIALSLFNVIVGVFRPRFRRWLGRAAG